MKLFIYKNKGDCDQKAFEIIKNQISTKPGSLLGLAVGKTTDGLYRLISKDAKLNPERWSRLKIFQIDENLGISPESDLSFNKEIRKELKELFKIVYPKNIFLIDGTHKPDITIKNAYKFIYKNKGIDLTILGLGPEYDPHIAYNTTGTSSLNSKMRVVDLHPKTILVIARKGKALTKPRQRRVKQSHNCEIASELKPLAMTYRGITLGIKDILKAKKVLLIAYGKEKAKSVKLAFKGKVDTKKASASALKLHKNLYVVMDKGAGKYL